MTPQFNPQSYTPIDYRTWILGNQARKGINLKRLNILSSQELELWKALEKYQDSRDDAGHGEMATYLAIKLLPYHPEAITEIVIPTTMAHDIGFYGEDPNAWQRAVEKARKEKKLESLDDDAKRMPHQLKGADIALDVFRQVGYPDPRYHQECANIIKDHDTRHNPTTPSGKVVWDSDYTWRVTMPCSQIYLFNKGILNPPEVLKELEKVCLNTTPPRDLGDVAKQITRIELANTIFHKFPTQAEQTLTLNYSKEFQLIKQFYSQPQQSL